MRDPELLTSRDPTTGLLIKRDHNEKLVRLEWYTELHECWTYQYEIAKRKDYLPPFRTASKLLEAALRALENSYSKEELFGPEFTNNYYKNEIDNTRVDRSDDGPSVPDATGDSNTWSRS